MFVGNCRTVCNPATSVIAYQVTRCHKSKYDSPILILGSKGAIVVSTQINTDTVNVSC
jgi:hypothetical protein